MLSNELSIYLQNKMDEIRELIDFGEIIFDQVVYYKNISKTQEKLKSKYLDIQNDFMSKDPKIVSENGQVT